MSEEILPFISTVGKKEFKLISRLKISISSVPMFITINSHLYTEISKCLLLYLKTFITSCNETYRMMQFKDILSLVVTLRIDLGRGYICQWQDLGTIIN